MNELSPNASSGIYSASGAEVFEKIITFFSDMLSHLMNNDFFVIIIGLLCVLLAFSLFRHFTKVLV